MAEYRQNADWRERDHPRDTDGKFADKGNTIASSKQPKRKQVKLNKREYAIVCHKRAEQYAKQKYEGVVLKEDYVFTDKSFVAFQNLSYGNFKVVIVLDIEKDKEIIGEYLSGDKKWR